MLKSKFNPAINSFVSLSLKPIGLFLIALVFLSCATLPTPERKLPSHAYDPPSDSRLAVITRDFVGDADDAP